MEDGMQTVTPGASHLEATPIAYGTGQFGGDWESVDEQAAVAGLVREGLTRHVGVSNYNTDQITAFAAVLSAETVHRRPRSHPEPRRPRRNRQHHSPAVPLGGPSLEGMT
jgi:aryl-alcohol dehydrogenase-like predicted oxidoreductase